MKAIANIAIFIPGRFDIATGSPTPPPNRAYPPTEGRHRERKMSQGVSTWIAHRGSSDRVFRERENVGLEVPWRQIYCCVAPAVRILAECLALWDRTGGRLTRPSGTRHRKAQVILRGAFAFALFLDIQRLVTSFTTAQRTGW